MVGASAASSSGRVEYSGGSGRDTVTFGTAAAAASGEIVIKLGSDTAADTVTFEGTVDPAGAGGVTIDNFDVNNDTIVLAQPDAADVTLITDGTGTRVTATDIEFTIKGITANELMAVVGASGVEIRSYPGPFWTNDEVADSADVSITGTTADEYIGYSSTSTPDPLSNLGKGSGNTATFDMSAGGNNAFVVGASAASSSGRVEYSGGPGRDTVTFGTAAAADFGEIVIKLGSDTAADTVTFEGTVDPAGAGGVTIDNFDVNDTIVLEQPDVADVTLITDGTGTRITATDIEFTIKGTTANQLLIIDGASGVELLPYFGPFWTNDEVPDSADVSILGTTADEYIGYSSTSTRDPLRNLGEGSGNTATFDMSAGGNNVFEAIGAASDSGRLEYTGGSGKDDLTFDRGLAMKGGNAKFDLSLGGNNTLTAGTKATLDSGSLVYIGGSGDDSLIFGDFLANTSGKATFDLSLGGNNTFVAAQSAAYFSGSVAYTGGAGEDSLTFDQYLAAQNGTATFDMSLGGDNAFLAATSVAAWGGSFAYTGGSGDDSLTFSDDLAAHDGNATFDMSRGGTNTFAAGDDAAAYSGSLVYTGGAGNDSLTFGGWLALEGGSATFDLSLGGNNTFVAAQSAAISSGSVAYTGGSGNDSLTFGDYLATGGTASFDMSRGGNNTFVAGNSKFLLGDTVWQGSSIVYTGGAGEDSLTFDQYLAAQNGTATFDMSLGGDNAFLAATSVAAWGGSFAYTGGSGDDSLTFSDDLAAHDGNATFDMSRGGTNTFAAGDDAAAYSGSLVYTGGAGNDSLTFGGWLAQSGTATFDLSSGGNNTFVAAQSAAYFSGSVAYTGGSGDDSLTFGGWLALEGGSATFDLSLGGNNTFVAGASAASSAGRVEYSGGPGRDTVTFGTRAAANSGEIVIDMGSDTAADTVTFEGTVDPAGSKGVTIDNFDVNHDTILLAQPDAADVTLITDGTGTRVTATDIEFTIKGITADQLLAVDGASGVEFQSSYLGPIWTDAEVADSADVSITGTTADEYIGYSSASTPDPLSNLGKGSGNTATFDMSAGGTNRLSAGSSVAASGGQFIYTGGAGRDILSFGADAAEEGQMSIDLGDDSSIDEITFAGLVGANTPDAALNSVSIANFKADDTITLQAYTHNQITFTPYADNTLVTAPSGLAFTVSGLTPNQVEAISDNGSAQIRVAGAGSSAGTSAFFSL